MIDPDLTPDDVERGLLRFVGDRLDLERRLPELIATAIDSYPDQETLRRMLRQGASVLVGPRTDGTASLLVAYGEDAEMLAALRASVWDAEREEPPPQGSPERGEQLTVAVFAVSALASVPHG